MDIPSDVITAFFGLLSAGITGSVTYLVTKGKARREISGCKEQYLDDKLKEIIILYQTEVKQLREDVVRLTRENSLLREEIIDLKERLFREEE